MSFQAFKIYNFYLGFALIFCGGRGHAQERISDETWHSSREILREARPLEPNRTLPFLAPLKDIFVRAFSNIEHAKELAKFESERVAPLNPRQKGVLLSVTPAFDTKQNDAVKKSLGSSLRSFVEKEGKVDILPDSMRNGLNFDWGRKKAPAYPAPAPRYRLIVTNIEPDKDAPKLASVNADDYELLPYAGKADLHYAIGPVYDEPEVPIYRVGGSGSDSLWQTLTESPSLQFRGRIVPKGLGSDGKLTAAQIVKLEQLAGYYSLEAEIRDELSPAAATHRFRAPLPLGSALIGEDRDKDFRKIKTSLENIYSFHGFSLNVDHYQLEKRYQTGLMYRAGATQIEILTHIPEEALADDFWPRHRWELKMESSF